MSGESFCSLCIDAFSIRNQRNKSQGILFVFYLLSHSLGCLIVNILLVFVIVTVSSPSSMCEQVLRWRHELHLYDSRGALAAPLFDPGGFWVYGS